MKADIRKNGDLTDGESRIIKKISSVDRAGVGAVKKWLEENDFTEVQDEPISNETVEISAKRNDKRVLIAIKASIYPLDPGFLSNDEKLEFMNRAQSRGAIPKFARVWLTEDLTLKDELIMWSRV